MMTLLLSEEGSVMRGGRGSKGTTTSIWRSRATMLLSFLNEFHDKGALFAAR
ncbi:hypothetical protein OK016_05330 [Vibrio chagasii]|nr:hypothetical protein [Vibrio chagasii]